MTLEERWYSLERWGYVVEFSIIGNQVYWLVTDPAGRDSHNQRAAKTGEAMTLKERFQELHRRLDEMETKAGDLEARGQELLAYGDLYRRHIKAARVEIQHHEHALGRLLEEEECMSPVVAEVHAAVNRDVFEGLEP